MMKLIKYTLTLAFFLISFQASAEDGVSRANFTTAIDQHEPTDEITRLDTTANKIYYFTEIKGLKGQTITHRWEQNGQVQANVTFKIGGNRWRIWSSKNLEPHLTGQWQVMVVDEAGNVLSQNSFNYGDSTDTAAESSTTVTTPDATKPSTTSTTTEETATQTIAAPVEDKKLSKISPAASSDTETTTTTSN